MIHSIKQTVLTGWHPIRWLYLAFGVFCLGQAFLFDDTFIGYIGGLSLVMALANMSCCGPGRCTVPAQGDKKDEPEETSYKEVKS